MSKHRRKLQSLLLDIAKAEQPATIPEIGASFDKFLDAVEKEDLVSQKKAIVELCGRLAGWAIKHC